MKVTEVEQVCLQEEREDNLLEMIRGSSSI